MIRRDLLRRTPARLALTFSLLFIGAFLALFSVLYVGISARVESDLKHRVEETITAITAFDDPKDVIEIVRKEAESVRDSDFIFAAVDERGRHLAGNVKDVPAARDKVWVKGSTLSLSDENADPEDAFYVTWRPIQGGRLVVGIGNRAVRRMQSYLVRVLGYGLIGMVLVAGLVSASLAREAQRRIQVFSRTLDRVARGEIVARVPMSRSGDDIDQVAVQVNRMLGKLQTLIENVNQSSSDIAHDLKRPIGRIRQKLEEVSRSAGSVAEFRQVVDSSIEDFDAIARTFDALLRITQIEAGASKSRFTRVDLSQVLDELWEVYAPVTEDAGHRLAPPQKCEVPATIMGDPELLMQLFSNLIENAVCHTPPGTHIALQLQRSDGKLVATVCDTGPGIPEHERQNAFRRLYRLERARSTPGSGLGLSMAAAIAELHDARITLADNAPGLKAVVEFANPLPA